MSIVYFEGAFLPHNEAKIPISDRGFLFGDGAYATIQVKDGFPFFLEMHLERLQEQCASFGLLIPHIKPELVFELIRLNEAFSGVWRLKVVASGGDSPLQHLPFREGRLLMFMQPYDVPARNSLKVGVYPYPIMNSHSTFKSLAHLNRFYVMEKAKEKRVDDCITLTEGRTVLECAFGNLFWIEDGTFYTPCPSLPLHFGVTITNALKIASTLGYTVQLVKVPFEKLPLQAYYFRTNTMGGLRPIAQIDALRFPLDDDLDRKFCMAYEDLIYEKKAALV